MTDALDADCDKPDQTFRRVVVFIRIDLDSTAHLHRGWLCDSDAATLATFVSFAELVDDLRSWLDQQREAAI